MVISQWTVSMGHSIDRSHTPVKSEGCKDEYLSPDLHKKIAHGFTLQNVKKFVADVALVANVTVVVVVSNIFCNSDEISVLYVPLA